MTTVGYGDYKAFTILGRSVSIFLIIWGSFSTSLIVVAVKNFLNMDNNESRVIVVFDKLKCRQELVDSAADLLSLMIA
jgi:hypothetical protein